MKTQEKNMPGILHVITKQPKTRVALGFEPYPGAIKSPAVQKFPRGKKFENIAKLVKK